jgi:hypothetical protein
MVTIATMVAKVNIVTMDTGVTKGMMVIKVTKVTKETTLLTELSQLHEIYTGIPRFMSLIHSSKTAHKAKIRKTKINF